MTDSKVPGQREGFRFDCGVWVAWVHRENSERDCHSFVLTKRWIICHPSSHLSCPELQCLLKQHLLAKWEREGSLWQSDTLPFLGHSAAPAETVREWALLAGWEPSLSKLFTYRASTLAKTKHPKTISWSECSKPGSWRSTVSSLPLAFKGSWGNMDGSFFDGRIETGRIQTTKNTKMSISLWVKVLVSELVNPKFKPVIHFYIWKQLGHPCYIVMRIWGIAIFYALNILQRQSQ